MITAPISMPTKKLIMVVTCLWIVNYQLASAVRTIIPSVADIDFEFAFTALANTRFLWVVKDDLARLCLVLLQGADDGLDNRIGDS